MKPDKGNLYPALVRPLLWGLVGVSSAYFAWEGWQLGAGVQEAAAQVGKSVPAIAPAGGAVPGAGKRLAAKTAEPWERYSGAAAGRIFRQPQGGTDVPGDGTGVEPRAPGPENLALRGILYNPDNPGQSLALIADAAQGTTEIVGIGGTVGGARVTAISPGGVTLAWGERVQSLTLAAEQGQ